MTTAPKNTAPLYKASMIAHRDGHHDNTIHAKGDPTWSDGGWGFRRGPAETMCGLPLGRVAGVPHRHKAGLRGEVTCLECLDVMRDADDT